MFTRLLALPIIIILFIFLCLALIVDGSYSVYIIPLFIILAILYMFHPQIDWWWYKRNPPDTDPKVSALFERLIPFYQKLSAENKRLFRGRVQMYLHAVEFIGQVWPNVPEDIKAFVAANIVQLTFGREDYRMPMFERIVVYPKPFPTRQFPKQFHSAESFQEDGVLLFAAEQLLAGTTHPQKHYNVGLHEYANVLLLSYPSYNYPDLGEDSWTKFETISGFSKEAIARYIGLSDISPRPVSICLFFTFPEQFKKEWPTVFDNYQTIFNMNPCNAHDPIVDRKKVTNWYS